MVTAERSLKRTIQRVRNQAIRAPANPQSLTDMVVPEEYTKTSEWEQFLLFDSGPGEDRALLSASSKALDLLAASEYYFCDGTFSVAPSLFYQLYTVHALQYGQLFPCVFALLPNKRSETYARLFRALKAVAGDRILAPHFILTDFERAAIRALREEFPNAGLRGCFFHLAQACWCKVQELGLVAIYQDDEISLWCRTLPALSFVPAQGVSQVFNEIANVVPEELTNLLAYFERSYVGSVIGGRRRVSLFPIAFWNQYDAMVTGHPRTNNAIEGWHRAFQSMVSCSHPTIWTFIASIRKEEQLFNFRVNQAVAGLSGTPEKKKYQDQDFRIQNRVRSYEHIATIPYLRGIAYNISF